MLAHGENGYNKKTDGNCEAKNQQDGTSFSMWKYTKDGAKKSYKL